jgi:hypothetical protein
MGKKCIPGVICIENMTLFLLIIIVILLVYMHYVLRPKQIVENTKVIVSPSLGMIPTRSRDTFLDPYAPPLVEYPPEEIGIVRRPIVGMPVNVRTRGIDVDFQQMGILTRTNKEDMILPLMGRQVITGRDKWQYYTISNTGVVNTKLPIRLRGRDTMSEYGCDEIMDGDIVHVGGYNDAFRVTRYENNLLRYLPVL